jgi:hypothetical protein
VYEKLRGRAVNDHRSGQCDCSPVVSDIRAGFVFNGRLGLLLRHIGGKSPTLYHKVAYDAVKDGAVVETLVNIAQKVFNGFGGLVGPEFYLDLPKGGLHQNDGVNGLRVGLGLFFSLGGKGQAV